MDGIELIYKLQKVLRSNLQNVGDAMISGGVDNMEKYRYMLGQAQAYQYILQEISNLLETKEHDDTEQQQDLTNVVRFDEGGSKD